MFTGIIEELGVVKQIERQQTVRFTVLAKTVLEDLRIGDSLTVNGVCLTVVGFNTLEITVEISPETLEVTSLGAVKVGDGVNLERAMRLSDRLGGHLVSGHVDGVGRIRDRRLEGDTYVLCIEAPPDVLRYCVKKGSIAVDGISLTINDLTDRDFTVTIIPHTAKVTTLGLKGVGEGVNLETDLIGKYIEHFLRHEEPKQSEGRIDIEYLRRHKLL
ncbi:MAG: riboflavin synthase [Nitrospiria bacterium]